MSATDNRVVSAGDQSHRVTVGLGCFGAWTSSGCSSQKTCLTLASCLDCNLGGNEISRLSIGSLGMGLGVLNHVVKATEHPGTAIDDALERLLTSVLSNGWNEGAC